jgi:hypothetical protein
MQKEASAGIEEVVVGGRSDEVHEYTMRAEPKHNRGLSEGGLNTDFPIIQA